MKIEDTLLGFVEYENKKSPFVYEKGLLQLLPVSEEEWKKNKHDLLRNFGVNCKVRENEWIGESLLYGKLHNGKEIVFSVSNCSSNNNGFKSFEVSYFMQYEKQNLQPDSILGISVTGREVNYFYTPAKAFSTSFSISEDGIETVNVNTGIPKEIVIGSYLYKECKVTVSISLKSQVRWSSDIPLTAQSKLKLSFAEPQSIEYSIAVYEHILRFFFYVCGRTNISLNDMELYGLFEGKERISGVLRFVDTNVNEEKDEKCTMQIIKYEVLGEHICDILQEIANNKLYFQHYRSSIREKHSYGIDRIILNFTAFEREERNIYTAEQERSEDYLEARDKSLAVLDELRKKMTGKRKKYVKGFISSISKSENKYADRMKKALIDCKEILKPFLIHDYYGYNEETSEIMFEEITDRMNNLRNNVVHGNLGMTIEAININDFSVLENLLYAMRLKSIGMDILSIQKAICSVRGYNIRILSKIEQSEEIEVEKEE